SGLPVVLVAGLALFYPDAWIAEHPAEAGSVMPAPASPEAMRHHLDAVAVRDGPALSAITVPTLVVHGDEDQLAVPENAELLAQGMTDARLVMLTAARHAYWVGNPDAHRQVRAFLAEHDPTA
ncbi:MAG: hypothetical protein QM607_11885, partial [Microbacterium sp.]